MLLYFWYFLKSSLSLIIVVLILYIHFLSLCALPIFIPVYRIFFLSPYNKKKKVCVCLFLVGYRHVYSNNVYSSFFLPSLSWLKKKEVKREKKLSRRRESLTSFSFSC